MSSIYENPVVAAASATFGAKVCEVYGPDYGNMPRGKEQSTLHALGAITGNLANTLGMNSPEFKEAEAKYDRIVPSWTVFVHARDAAAAAVETSIDENPVVAATSAAFGAKVCEVYGPDYANIPRGQEESTLHALGAIVGRILETHGKDSPEFKEAAAKYARIVPAWTAFESAHAAALAAK